MSFAENEIYGTWLWPYYTNHHDILENTSLFIKCAIWVHSKSCRESTVSSSSSILRHSAILKTGEGKQIPFDIGTYLNRIRKKGL